jgi:hypothetical protein
MSLGQLARREHVALYSTFTTVVKDSRWICGVIPPSPVDDKAFASMGVQYLATSVETQPVTFL